MTFLAGIFGKDLVHERSAKQQLVYVTRLYYTIVASQTINFLSENLTFFQNKDNVKLKLSRWKDLVHERSAKQQLVYVLGLYHIVFTTSPTVNAVQWFQAILKK